MVGGLRYFMASIHKKLERAVVGVAGLGGLGSAVAEIDGGIVERERFAQTGLESGRDIMRAVVSEK